MQNNQRRQKSLLRLSQSYAKIQYMQLSETDFPTNLLQELCLLTEYSIHPSYCNPQTYNFYKKLLDYYWDNISSIKEIPQVQRSQQKQADIIVDEISSIKSTKSTQNDKLSNSHEEIVQNTKVLEESKISNLSEAIQKQSIKVQQMVSKNYVQIKKLLKRQHIIKSENDQNTSKKIKLLKSWTVVNCKLQNFIAPKKPVQNLAKPLKNQQENIQLGKINRKESTVSQTPKTTIILGKNESTQTKQMKHILKVQAKVNFVDQKKKEEQKLSTLQKKSIQLTYLLNIITKQFFNDFSNEIQAIVKENNEIIPLLCMKIIEKIKQQHNFIQIYMNLIKKLCQSKSKQTSKQCENSQKQSQLQQTFVQILQKDFLKVVSEQVEPSEQNFDEYKYQKKVIGLTTFIGKLINCNILSRKIFKTCFWQILHRYAQKCKKNPQNDIVNQCLIQGAILISQNMGQSQIYKIIMKEKESKNIQRLIDIQQNRLEEMMDSLVNFNDENVVCREDREDKPLVDRLSVMDYPEVLRGVVQNFSSKRLKLKFLVENWIEKFRIIPENQQKNYNSESNTKVSIVNQIKQKPQEKVQKVPQKSISPQNLQLIEDYLIELQMISSQSQIKNASDEASKELHHRKQTLQQKIRNQISKSCHQTNSRTLQLDQSLFFKELIDQFLNKFADTSSKSIMHQTIKNFLSFTSSLNSQQIYEKILTIITQNQFQTLMIIQCDFPYLIDGLKIIFSELMNKLNLKEKDVFGRIEKKLDFEDEDMVEFYEKVKKSLPSGSQEILED